METGLTGALWTPEPEPPVPGGGIKTDRLFSEHPRALGLPYKTHPFYTLIPSERHVTHEDPKICTIRVAGPTSSRWADYRNGVKNTELTDNTILPGW